MLIIVERKSRNLSEDAVKISLQDFVKIIGRKKMCTVQGQSKSGLMDFVMSPPAFCGFMDGYFFLTEGHGKLSIRFSIRSIVFVEKEEPGTDARAMANYTIHLKDGTILRVRLP